MFVTTFSYLNLTNNSKQLISTDSTPSMFSLSMAAWPTTRPFYVVFSLTLIGVQLKSFLACKYAQPQMDSQTIQLYPLVTLTFLTGFVFLQPHLCRNSKYQYLSQGWETFMGFQYCFQRCIRRKNYCFSKGKR